MAETLLLSPRRPRAVIDVLGTQAQAFLHRMLTQDVKSMPVGSARRAAFLTREGRVLADPVVWRFPDCLRLVLDPGAAAKAVPALERYVIADDVTFSDVTSDWAHLLLLGASAPAALLAAGLAVPDAGRFLGARLADADVLVLRRDLGALPAFEFLVPAQAAGTASRALSALPGVVPAGEEALDAARVEAGVGAWGAEIDERVLPNEAGLEEALSWTKGCYLGQEPVVMARHRGHPPSLLVRLSVAGDAVPAREAALLDGARRVGRVTTAARRPAAGGVTALGYLRHEFARPGASFAIEGLPATATATVTAVLAR